MVYLLTLLSLLSIQPEEIHNRDCTCKISGIEEWDLNAVCRGLCPQENDKVNSAEFKEKKVSDLEEYYRHAGFLDVEVAGQIRVDDEGRVEISVTVNEGPKYVVGEILVEVEGGEFDLAPFRELLIIHPGEPCNQQRADLSRWRLGQKLGHALKREKWDINWVDMKYIKHPDSKLVDLRYVLKIPGD